MRHLSVGTASLAVASCAALSAKVTFNNLHDNSVLSRRGWISKIGLISSSTALLKPTTAEAAVDVRQYTALAPLGRPTSTGSKSTGLPISEVASRLSHDLVEGSSGKGGYFISGDISTDIFRDDCEFTDPTNSVSSLTRYKNALQILFDPEQSFVELLGMEVDESNHEIRARIRSGGVLQLPWKPFIPPYESTIKYAIDEDGLIARQIQDWSIPASQALVETFTPSTFSPPFSNLSRPQNEPKEVTDLFNLVNGHRPDSYTQEVKLRIDTLIDLIVGSQYEWHKEDLDGTWALAYLQPGPTGGGIDRRIPFPDLPFNNNYQTFTQNTVTNIGELFGSLLTIRVGGSLLEEDERSTSTPKRFKANIDRGGLCVGEEKCIPLPITGDGLFDGVYLGKRLRIGQNLNGGGARVVQVRVA
ncbi:hypothetical protein HJC23_003727 [Cyclotella cryptica]|uniref:Plastid lipid-associated protein/fibrillin conserved domain-containing protein n=1 Tax=Cyclotella cryptica TaxID=29204 RepID=A0ABD3QT80_9STRA|eukprot:CCRYP_002141-RA/>CCRYP_002141-RA protein AED:0.08 eAED:0.08 QI:0/-1/0/1/-1/1/1/0/415